MNSRWNQSHPSGERKRTVDLHLAVPNNRPDLSLLLEILQALARERAVDLEAIHQCRHGHEAVGLYIFVELVGGGLVEDDGVLGLVLDYSATSRQQGSPDSACKDHPAGIALPFPLDHFFFCFFPPAAGAMLSVGAAVQSVTFVVRRDKVVVHFCGGKFFGCWIQRGSPRAARGA